MPYVGKKPADIIATAVDTTTGTFSGAVSAASVDADGGVTVDNITIDGTEIDLSSGNLTIDVAGQLVINSDSGQVVLQDDTVNWGNLQNSSGDFVIESLGTDKDMIFKGLDGSSVITALTLDMSAGGNATFNGSIFSGGNVVVPNGNGIDFSAAGNVSGMTSELLNDYEEGTFTATLFGTSSGSGTNVTTTGSYIKVGKHVTIGAYFQNVNLSSMSGSMNIIGLPFTTNGEASSINTGSVALYGFSFTGFVTPYIGNNSTTIDMLDSRTGAAWAGLAVPQAAGKYMIISLTYKSS